MNPAAATNFGSLPLHDAILKELRVDWSARTCVAEIDAFVDRKKDAQPRKLVWQKVSKISVPHEEPWGPSVFINAVRQEENCYIVEMQSGDQLRIHAEAFEFL